MGTPCSTQKFRISPTASTSEYLNSDHPLVDLSYQFLSNVELIGPLETAPTIVRYYSKKLQDSGQIIEAALAKLDQMDDQFQKIWNQIISELKIVANVLKGATKDPLFVECLPIISFNLFKQYEELEAQLGSKKGQQIRRTQSYVIRGKVQRVDKRHQTDKI